MHFSWIKGRCLPCNATGAVWKGALALLLCGLLWVASALLVLSGTMAAPDAAASNREGHSGSEAREKVPPEWFGFPEARF